MNLCKYYVLIDLIIITKKSRNICKVTNVIHIISIVYKCFNTGIYIFLHILHLFHL